MEAIAALGLASSILQVIDFPSKFVSVAWKIYRRGHDDWHKEIGDQRIDVLRAIRQDLAHPGQLNYID